MYMYMYLGRTAVDGSSVHLVGTKWHVVLLSCSHGYNQRKWRLHIFSRDCCPDKLCCLVESIKIDITFLKEREREREEGKEKVQRNFKAIILIKNIFLKQKIYKTYYKLCRNFVALPLTNIIILSLTFTSWCWLVPVTSLHTPQDIGPSYLIATVTWHVGHTPYASMGKGNITIINVNKWTLFFRV